MSEGEPLHVVFGAGVVGRAVVGELVGRGARVRVVTRSGEATGVPEAVEVVGGDAAHRGFAREAAAGASVVYSCVGMAYERWEQEFPRVQAGVLEGAAGGGARLVAIDDCTMYGPAGGKPLTEGRPYIGGTPKGLVRARVAEDFLRAHRKGRLEVAIGRAADLFGPGVGEAAMGARVFRPTLRGEAAPVLGDPDVLHTYAYVPDIARALVVLGERDEAPGRAWHLPAPETVTTRQFVEKIFEECGHPPKLRVVSKLHVRFLGWFNPAMKEPLDLWYLYEEPFVVDHSDFAAAFGDHATPLETAIRDTVAWYAANPAEGSTGDPAEGATEDPAEGSTEDLAEGSTEDLAENRAGDSTEDPGEAR